MNYRKIISCFNYFSPVPLSAISWFALAFSVSVFFDGWKLSFDSFLLFSVWIINSATLIYIIRLFSNYSSAPRSYLIKTTISILLFLLLNTILLVTTNWKYLLAYILLSLPLVIVIMILSSRNR